MASALADRLRRVIPAKSVLDSPLQLALYGYDGTFYEGRPDAVVLPETTEQVAAVVRTCHRAGVPVIPRGAATSLSGGPVPVRGGVVVAFTRMDRILELDYANHRATVQPGVVNLDFQKVLEADGFFYAPDPASQSVCTLGGNVGENSGGPHCLKYGVTANHIMGLTIVLPDGRVARMGAESLDGPGLDLVGLIVGSEGTFGLVTEITCRILPQPDAVATMLAIFDTLAGASQSVSDIIADGIIPATLEMMDNAMIQAVERHLAAGYPLDAEAVLIIEVDGLRTGLNPQIVRIEQVCARNRCRSFRVAADETERALLWKGRKGAFGAVTNIMPSKICTDVSVPRTELPKMLAGVTKISRKWDVPITNVFHAGDGNLHPLILFDPRDNEQFERAKSADREITELALAIGGVLTGEHGIGCGKRRYMLDMFSPAELRLMWRIKDAFDPAGLCNPDKVLPDRSDIPDAPAETTAIETASLNRIVSLDYTNLTVTAECGVMLSALEDALAEHNQTLGIRPRRASRTTVGSMIASGDFGPNRLLYGAPRDRVLGIKAALPSGEIVRFGGSCVKNVAGYAVEKVLIGSRGTLATILEVTLRTFPRPEIRSTLAAPLDAPARAAAFFAELFASGLRPAAVELLNPAASRRLEMGERWQLLVGLEGFAADTDETARRLSQMAAEHGLDNWSRLDGDYFALWDRVADLVDNAPMLKLSCPLSKTAALAADLDAIDPAVPMRASTGLGLVFAAVERDPRGYASRVGEIITRHAGASCWLAPVPDGCENPIDPTVADVCRAIKHAFDPEGVLPML